jgi:hypothetical protein
LKSILTQLTLTQKGSTLLRPVLRLERRFEQAAPEHSPQSRNSRRPERQSRVCRPELSCFRLWEMLHPDSQVVSPPRPTLTRQKPMAGPASTWKKMMTMTR